METRGPRRIARFVMFLPVFLLVFAGLVWAVYGLWNWLMPDIFGVHAIGYWQALGLMVLSWILFGGLRGHGRGSWRHDMRRRWGRMTPEEREAFAKALNSRWGRTESPGPEPKT